MHTRSLLYFAIVPLVIFAQPARGQTRDERAIRARSEEWQKYIAEKNVDRIVALHTSDAVLMPSNMPAAKGAGAIRAAYSDLVNTPGLRLHWIPTKIDVASPSVATEYGTYTQSYETPRGRIGESGNYVTIWHKVNGEWRIAVDAPITTLPMPASVPAEAAQMVARSNEQLTWTNFTPNGFPTGGKISVLQGDPFSPGLFVLRLQLPDGYQIPLHWHPTGEYVTVISGDVQFGTGSSVDMSSAQRFHPGDFAFIPARQAHYGRATGVTVLQIAGQGPFVLNLGTPK
jgi:ketosteroid isomerase-like protein/mannose-6-phosphate isomerase-like protein (cupin superfamily)